MSSRHGKPVTFLLTAGQRSERAFSRPLLDLGAFQRTRRGQPISYQRRLVGDQDYSSSTACCDSLLRGMHPVIPSTSNEQPHRHVDCAVYRERNPVERYVNPSKDYRCPAMRYEKLAIVYLAMVTIAAILVRR